MVYVKSILTNVSQVHAKTEARVVNLIQTCILADVQRTTEDRNVCNLLICVSETRASMAEHVCQTSCKTVIDVNVYQALRELFAKRLLMFVSQIHVVAMVCVFNRQSTITNGNLSTYLNELRKGLLILLFLIYNLVSARQAFSDQIVR